MPRSHGSVPRSWLGRSRADHCATPWNSTAIWPILISHPTKGGRLNFGLSGSLHTKILYLKIDTHLSSNRFEVE